MEKKVFLRSVGLLHSGRMESDVFRTCKCMSKLQIYPGTETQSLLCQCAGALVHLCKNLHLCLATI